MTSLSSIIPALENVIHHLEKELQNLRGGRANSALVEDIRVEVYGSMMELKGVASISVPDAKTIQIEPWDKGVVKDIEKALIAANIGMTPNVAGTVIRLVVPQMTEENRRDTVKIIHQKGEQARIGVRNVREDMRATIAKEQEAKEISEDEKFRLFGEFDALIKDYNAKIEAVVAEKEAGVMTI